MQNKTNGKIKHIVCIGDTHAGSQAALMPPGFKLQDGQSVVMSRRQIELWSWWVEFWKFVDRVTDHEPFALVHNGDIIDGAHHGCVQLITNNVGSQRHIAELLLEPVVKKAAVFYSIAGTAAHAGQSNSDEESVAKHLGAVPDKDGRFARQDLWIELGHDLIQFAHHIGTTSSQAYKSSPAMRLMAAMHGAAGEWGFRPPTIMIRCLSEDTELLTRRGWIGVDSYRFPEEVMQWNPLTESLNWATPTDWVINDSEPEMVSIKGKGIDILVTPDHNMVRKSIHSNTWGYSKADEFIGHQMTIPVSGYYESLGHDISNCEARLLGLIMADGSIVKGYGEWTKSYAIRIGQTKSQFPLVEKIISDCGIEFSVHKSSTKAGTKRYDVRNGKMIVSKEDNFLAYIPAASAARFLNWMNDDKSLKPELMEMVKSQFDSLLDGFMIGDGAKAGGKLFNNNLKMLGQIQELLLKHGYKSKLTPRQWYYQQKSGQIATNYCLNHCKRTETMVNQDQKNAKLVSYGKRSWCVKAPSGAIVARRNGGVFITGNSHAHDYVEVKRPNCRVVVCPAWQLKSDWMHGKDTVSLPIIGGLVIKSGEEGVHIREFVRSPRPTNHVRL
jgi:hypothetical protein